jgi:hypothetical protein
MERSASSTLDSICFVATSFTRLASFPIVKRTETMEMITTTDEAIKKTGR